MSEDQRFLKLAGIREWQQALLLATRLQQASALLLLILITAVVASSLPLRLLDPGWYLTVADLLVANAPIAITSGCLGYLAHALSPLSGEQSSRRRWRFQKLCSLISIAYLTLLPLELLAGSMVMVQLKSNQHLQLTNLQAQQQQIARRLRSAGSIEDLNALLPQRARLANTPTPAGSVGQRRSALLEALASDAVRLQQRFSQQRQQQLLRLAINAFRVLIIALGTALFFRILAKPPEELLAHITRRLPQDE